VTANPNQAAAILTAALSVERKDIALIAGRLVGAAIEGLGPTARKASVLALVRMGIELQPSAVLYIVRAAVRAAPDSFRQAIVNTAIATLNDPSAELIARINEVATNARVGGDLDTQGLELIPNLDPVGELDQAPMLPVEPTTTAPLSPNIITSQKTSTQVRTPTPPPSPSF
jgi:hypothetical protein